MLNARRSLALHAQAGKELPRIPELRPLYNLGVKFRHGQVMMIAGRSGSQKSGFALWLAAQWQIPTLYFSADMSPFTASSRLASMLTFTDSSIVEGQLGQGGESAKPFLWALDDVPIQFNFGSPITWPAISRELDAYVEEWDSYPELIVFDNLMDFEGAEAEYSNQMEVMSNITDLTRDTGSSTLTLHHASDKTWDAKSAPFLPPSRAEVKGGLSEKPELTLSVALDPNDFAFNIACIKQRMGPSDPTARGYASLRAEPGMTTFREFGKDERRGYDIYNGNRPEPD